VGKIINAYSTLIAKLESKRLFCKPGQRREDNITIYYKEMGCELNSSASRLEPIMAHLQTWQ
jgi:hypothetical protein